jgi:hypothetical protein
LWNATSRRGKKKVGKTGKRARETILLESEIYSKAKHLR